MQVIQLPTANPATMPIQHDRRPLIEGASEAVPARDEQHDDDDEEDDDGDGDGDDEDEDGRQLLSCFVMFRISRFRQVGAVGNRTMLTHDETATAPRRNHGGATGDHNGVTRESEGTTTLVLRAL